VLVAFSQLGAAIPTYVAAELPLLLVRLLVARRRIRDVGVHLAS
jgi:hypothetical protein